MKNLEIPLKAAKKIKYRLIVEAFTVGIVGGLIATAYKYALAALKNASHGLYAAARERPAFIPLVFAALILLALGVAYILKTEPWVKGGGVPQVKAQIESGYKVNFIKVIVCKFLGGALATFAGLALGREGPSIQLGAESADGCAVLLKRGDNEKRFLLTCGAGAGLAAAFNAPLAGALIALEELRKDFNPSTLLSALAASVSATAVANLLGGSVHGAFSLQTQSLPLAAYGFVVIAGIVLGFAGLAYNFLLLKSIDAQKRLKMPIFFKVLPVFLIAGCVGLFIPLLAYDGHDILAELFSGAETMRFLNAEGLGAIGLILLIQFVFSILCFSSGTPGGNFFPVMVTGALIGAFLGAFFSRFLGMDAAFVINFTLLGMVGALTAVVRVPITAVVLCLELTNSFSHMLPFVLAALLAYLIPDLLNGLPIYDSLLLRLPTQDR
ncbi:hydrolase acting on acid anhydrides in phosphorous-containing anhydrides [Clostridia bacterium]|nr:hydrolase acting on acid anhydrides in phosphorous-containing anhydrides [Clostridia bacterium]